MNILLFLIPKSDVAFVYDHFTIRQALEKMEYHRYSAIPILAKDGKYIGTLTEGDLLWAIKNQYNLNLQQAEEIKISSIKRLRDNVALRANVKMDALLKLTTNQNFVPILDDENTFIGIITRRDIINYFYDTYIGKEKSIEIKG